MQHSSRSARMERLRNENLSRRQRQLPSSPPPISARAYTINTTDEGSAHYEPQILKSGNRYSSSSLSSPVAAQHQQVYSPSDWSRSSLPDQPSVNSSVSGSRGGYSASAVKSRSVLESSPFRSHSFASSTNPDEGGGSVTYHLSGNAATETSAVQSPIHRNFRSRQNQGVLPEIESIDSCSSMVSITSDTLSMSRQRKWQTNNQKISNQVTSQSKGFIKRQSTDDTGSTSGTAGPFLINMGDNGAYSDDDERTRLSIREEVLGSTHASGTMSVEARMNGVQRARYQQEKEQMRRKEAMARHRGKGLSIDNQFIEPSNSASSLPQEEWLRPDSGGYNSGLGRPVNVDAFSIGQKNPQEDFFTSKFQELSKSPLAKTAAGISAIVLVGCVISPVGIVIGAAAVGAGVGAMQLPEEKRNKLQLQASEMLEKANEHARILNESVSTSCVQVCEKTGIDQAAEKMNIPLNCEPVEDANKKHVANVRNSDYDLIEENTLDDGTVVDNISPQNVPTDGDRQAMMIPRVNLGNRKVACFRRCRIVPVCQIHSLDPSTQPRAWLDVMASILTTRDEKNEAMEEILILAKDKSHARMFLEEGLLDSLMWILSGFFKKYSALLRLTDDYNTATAYANEKQEASVRLGQNVPVQGTDNYVHAKLAANCCVTLGKVHCAIVHTEGDLLLMSAYNRGTVPIERQLAQMLFEVPHHTRVTTANMDATSSTEQNTDGDEFFTLKELTMQEAEHLAKLIKNVSDGKMDKQFGYNQLEIPPDL